MKTEVPDFSVVVQDLIDCGLTQTQIADEVGCSQVQISRLQRAVHSHPRADLALKLMDLHKRHMRNRRRRRAN